MKDDGYDKCLERIWIETSPNSNMLRSSRMEGCSVFDDLDGTVGR